MRPLCWLLAAVALVAGCGSDTASGCIELREPEDPASDRHVLTDGTFDYQTSPPTSGAHIAGPTPSGVLAAAVAAPIQVRLLEAGGVMIQYDPSVVDPTALERFGDEVTVVAPGIDLPEAVVATAWTWKLSCSEADLDRIERFARERRGDAPGLD